MAMTEGKLLDTLTELLGSVSPDVAKRAVASLADKFGVSASAGGRRRSLGSDDEDEEDEFLGYTSSLGTDERVNLTRHDREVARQRRG